MMPGRMQVHFGLGRMRPEWTASVVGIGTFDGFHIGHQAVAESAVRRAREAKIPAILVTFDRHPAAILSPHKAPAYLQSQEDALDCAAELGFDVAVVLPFDAFLSRMSADEFLNQILMRNLLARHLVVGHDFALGNGREGTATWLGQRIDTTVVPPFEIDRQRVSSTEIRRLVQQGDLGQANRLLGRPFRMRGVVVRGQQLGRTLGFPTANIARSFDQVLPKDGVYAAWAQTVHGKFAAALAIGVRPAVDGQERTIEAFLLDYPGTDLYGTSLALDLHAFLREEQDFPNLDALVAQMHHDVGQVSEILAIDRERSSM